MKQKFTEVRNDYTEDESGNIAIDAYMDDNDETPGRVVAWVTPDGEVLKGTNPECETDDLECTLVKEAIEEAKQAQMEAKEEFISEKVLDAIKKDVNAGDTTAIAELLRFCPMANLKAYLPEK